MKAEGGCTPGAAAGMELRHGHPVFGDHQRFTAAGHGVHQAEAAGFELACRDALNHDLYGYW